jgi:serine/threonine protein kinase
MHYDGYNMNNSPWNPGDIVLNDEFEILEHFQGGMADVYRAKRCQPILGMSDTVALKVPTLRLTHGVSGASIINLDEPDSAHKTDQFFRELEKWQWIPPNPFVVELESVRHSDSMFVLVLRWIDGAPMSELCNRGLPPWKNDEFSLSIALDIAIQLATALIHVHDAGVLHLDLKPSNVLIINGDETTRPLVKLTDFGLSSTQRTVTNDRKGYTIGFVAPEVLYPERFDNPNQSLDTDVFGFGLTILALAAGQPFWAGQFIDPEPGAMEAIVTQYGEARFPGSILSLLRQCVSFNRLGRDARPSMRTVRRELGLCYGSACGAESSTIFD